jgi:hypothetical protein
VSFSASHFLDGATVVSTPIGNIPSCGVTLASWLIEGIELEAPWPFVQPSGLGLEAMRAQFRAPFMGRSAQRSGPGLEEP